MSGDDVWVLGRCSDICPVVEGPAQACRPRESCSVCISMCVHGGGTGQEQSSQRGSRDITEPVGLTDLGKRDLRDSPRPLATCPTKILPSLGLLKPCPTPPWPPLCSQVCLQSLVWTALSPRLLLGAATSTRPQEALPQGAGSAQGRIASRQY